MKKIAKVYGQILNNKNSNLATKAISWLYVIKTHPGRGHKLDSYVEKYSEIIYNGIKYLYGYKTSKL